MLPSIDALDAARARGTARRLRHAARRLRRGAALFDPTPMRGRSKARPKR